MLRLLKGYGNKCGLKEVAHPDVQNDSKTAHPDVQF
jgi:hypothetical protein